VCNNIISRQARGRVEEWDYIRVNRILFKTSVTKHFAPARSSPRGGSIFLDLSLRSISPYLRLHPDLGLFAFDVKAITNHKQP